MSQPYVGEIRLFAGTFAPVGWELCNGQLISIAEYEVLFNLIGTTYGGDGQETFAVPDLRGRVPVHMGGGYTIGEMAGVEAVTLTLTQTPLHSHSLVGSAETASTDNPAGAIPAIVGDGTTPGFGSDLPLTTYAPTLVGSSGGSQPHSNMQPYLALQFIISMFGIFPSPT